MTIDARILSALRTAEESGVSGAELAHTLGISRAAVWARIEELRAVGFGIEASPHEGYRLVSVPNALFADDLLSRLQSSQVIGRDIKVFHETTSTNDVVERLARDGVKEGMVIFAESQTKGRGRLGRQWISPAGKGLWFSILLRPPIQPLEAPKLTIAAATSLVRAIRAVTGFNVEIKWPNDIVVRGKKLAGILTEMSAELDRIHYIILGIGLDVNFDAGDFPEEVREIATSLKLETGSTINRADLAVKALEELDHDYRRLREGAFDEIINEWESHCSTLGKTIEVQTGPHQLKGRAEALDSSGALLLRTQHGHLERILAGDVTLRRS
ncbi:MAG: biotin--[acetyl-CoA-carboxylase] ligase [Verrucomicrobiales bacterium]